MATVILVRHGRSTANNSGVLAGRTPQVALDEHGRTQAEALVDRLRDIPLSRLVTSPLLRCEQTLTPLADQRDTPLRVESSLSEVDYGDWTGQELKQLVDEPLWRVVQNHPSAASFPGGEGLANMQARAVAAVRRHDAEINAEHGEHAVWLLCSHGDVIKSVLTDALGQHLDLFQRIIVDPGSVSVIRYTETRPFILRLNDLGGDLGGIVPPAPDQEDGQESGQTGGGLSSDADVGGSTGRKEQS